MPLCCGGSEDVLEQKIQKTLAMIYTMCEDAQPRRRGMLKVLKHVHKSTKDQRVFQFLRQLADQGSSLETLRSSRTEVLRSLGSKSSEAASLKPLLRKVSALPLNVDTLPTLFVIARGDISAESADQALLLLELAAQSMPRVLQTKISDMLKLLGFAASPENESSSLAARTLQMMITTTADGPSKKMTSALCTRVKVVMHAAHARGQMFLWLGSCAGVVVASSLLSRITTQSHPRSEHVVLPHLLAAHALRMVLWSHTGAAA